MKDRIQAQRLNRQVAILRRADGTDDGFGKGPGALKRVCWRFASVKPARRREAAEGAGVSAKPEQSIWLRWDEVTREILPTDRAVLDGRIYELTAAPMEVGFRFGVELLVVATDPAQEIDPDALAAWP